MVPPKLPIMHSGLNDIETKSSGIVRKFII
jgi:hypothetical protein